MGIMSRLFGRDDAPATTTALDCAAVKGEVDALIDALGQLADAMDQADSPMSNPGWRGRLRDLRSARGDLRLLTRKQVFTKDELFEVLTTVRPLYRGEPPKDFAHLASLNTVVVAQVEAVHRAAN